LTAGEICVQNLLDEAFSPLPPLQSGALRSDGASGLKKRFSSTDKDSFKNQSPISRITHPVETSVHTELAATLKRFIE
jgi:hypothetical protein